MKWIGLERAEAHLRIGCGRLVRRVGLEGFAALLTRQGHTVTTPDCTGLGERRHLVSDAIHLSLHVDDITNHLEMHDLHAVTLVGWSYGGMLLASVVAACPQRIESLIYLDGFVPENGKSVADYSAPEVVASFEACRATNSPVPPLSLDVFGVSDPAIVEFVQPRIAMQPWRTFLDKADITSNSPHMPTSYIRCEHHCYPPFDEAAQRVDRDPHARVVRAPMGHLCMLTQPRDTSEILLSLA